MDAQEPPPSPTIPASAPVKKEAPLKRLPKVAFNSVEYPGPISRQPASVDYALSTLGKQPAVDACFNRATRILELRYDVHDTWSHPIVGENVPVQRLVLRVTRRRRKVKQPSEPSSATNHEFASSTAKDANVSSGGVFKAEIMGVVKSTVRFRAMADYRYTPDTTARIPNLIEALKSADPEPILEFDFKDTETQRVVPTSAAPLDPSILGGDGSGILGDPNASETRSSVDHVNQFRNTMPTLPPPMFSRQVAPHSFLYQANPTTKVVPYTHPVTGEEYQRLSNTNRAKTYAVMAIRFHEHDTPESPVEEIKEAAKKLDQTLLQKLQNLVKQRPMWTRVALLNQFTVEEVKLLDSKKAYIPFCAYTFQDGFARELLIAFGYDPRKDPEAYLYQKVHFRITARGQGGIRVKIRRHIDSDFAAEQSGASAGRITQKSHIFDGKALHRSEATYQLVDITDSLLYDLIRDPNARSSSVDFISGWYKPEQLNAIKGIVRRKWLALSENRICTDEDCFDLVEEFYSRKPPSRPAEEPSHRGRPKGGGGYAAGEIPTNTTTQATSKKDKWKRKAVARLPATAEDLTAARLQETLEREQREALQARYRDGRDQDGNGN